MQSPFMSSPLDGDFLFNEGEVVVGCDVIDDSPKAFYGNVLGYVSFTQDFLTIKLDEAQSS